MQPHGTRYMFARAHARMAVSMSICLLMGLPACHYSVSDGQRDIQLTAQLDWSADADDVAPRAKRIVRGLAHESEDMLTELYFELNARQRQPSDACLLTRDNTELK